MKTSKILDIIIVVLILGLLAFALFRKDEPVVISPEPVGEGSDVLGCYVARIGEDVYTLNLEKETQGNVSGTLEFDNFQKDSSSGTFAGTYQNGILLGDYSFQSEGTFSVMQVVFQKTEDGFVRGYGPVDGETGTRFTDLTKITYDASSPLSTFKKEACPE